MAIKPLRASSDGLWQAQGGKSRNFINVQTGETISRRQFDKRYGALAKGGFTSYERKAAASAPEVRLSRPAINRPVGSKRGLLSRMNPLTEKQSRDYVIPLNVYYTGNDIEFQNDIEYFREQYNTAIDEILSNKATINGKRETKVLSISFVIIGENERTGRRFNNTVQTAITPESAPSFDKFVSEILVYAYDGDDIQGLSLALRFRKPLIKTSDRKKKMKEIRRLKTVREKTTARAKKSK